MGLTSTVELTDLEVPAEIGTYGPNDVVPRAHGLDLTLSIDPRLVMIPADGMAHVFDYDPLIQDIDRIAQDGPYATQERLMTRIVEACARYTEIEAVSLMLWKTPVLGETGKLGVRLSVSAAALSRLRRG